MPLRPQGDPDGSFPDLFLPEGGETGGRVYPPGKRDGRGFFRKTAAEGPGGGSAHRGKAPPDTPPGDPFHDPSCGVVERVDRGARVVAGGRIEPALLFPVGAVGRGGVGKLVERRQPGVEDDDAPEPRPLLPSFLQGPEELSCRHLQPPVVLLHLPFRHLRRRDDAGTGDDVEPPYAGDVLEVVEEVFLAHRAGGGEEEGLFVEEPGAKMQENRSMNVFMRPVTARP